MAKVGNMEQPDNDFIPWVTNPTADLVNACLAEGIRCYVSEQADLAGFTGYRNDLFVHEDDFQKASEVYNRLWNAK